MATNFPAPNGHKSMKLKKAGSATCRAFLWSSVTACRAMSTLVIVVFVLLAVTGCSPPSNPFVHYPVATHPQAPNGATLLVRLQGKLDGQVNKDGAACLWIGTGGTKTLLIWPTGYFAAGDPLEIRDEVGRRLGKVGEQITLGGGPGPDPASTLVMGCGHASSTFLVTEVVQGG